MIGKQKKIITKEEIESLTKKDLLSLEQWQISSLDENDIKKIIQKKHAVGIELHPDDKILIGLEITDDEPVEYFMENIFDFIFLFMGIVVFYLIFDLVFE